LDVAPSGTRVTLRVSATRDAVTLRVVDEGPGLTDEQRRRAFDRFWRGSGGQDGAGLGLAIARRLADASGATVELRAAASGGTEASASFRPATTPATGAGQPSATR